MCALFSVWAGCVCFVIFGLHSIKTISCTFIYDLLYTSLTLLLKSPLVYLIVRSLQVPLLKHDFQCFNIRNRECKSKIYSLKRERTPFAVTAAVKSCCLFVWLLTIVKSVRSRFKEYIQGLKPANLLSNLSRHCYPFKFCR